MRHEALWQGMSPLCRLHLAQGFAPFAAKAQSQKLSQPFAAAAVACGVCAPVSHSFNLRFFRLGDVFVVLVVIAAPPLDIK